MANYWDNPDNICIDEVTNNQLYFETLKDNLNDPPRIKLTKRTH